MFVLGLNVLNELLSHVRSLETFVQHLGLVPGQGDAKATQRGSVFHDTRIWLDKADSMVAGMALAFTSLRPVLHGLRAMFGLSLLFYGHEFATLAFHIIVFRLSGWKKVRLSGWKKGTIGYEDTLLCRSIFNVAFV